MHIFAESTNRTQMRQHKEIQDSDHRKRSATEHKPYKIYKISADTKFKPQKDIYKQMSTENAH